MKHLNVIFWNVVLFVLILTMGCRPSYQYKIGTEVTITSHEISGRIVEYGLFSDIYVVTYKDKNGVIHRILCNVSEIEEK